MFEMLNLVERIGLPSLSALSIGSIFGLSNITGSPAWYFTVDLIGVLAGLSAIVWFIIKCVNLRRENKSNKSKQK